MGGYATDFSGGMSDPLGSIESTAQEAWTGNLSDIDKSTIINNTNNSIAQAGAGLDPATVSAQQTQASADINSVLDTFSLNGDSGGAQPTTNLRLPGGLTVSPATLEWAAIGLAIVILGAVIFPVIAPLAVSNIKAGKAVSGA